MLRLRHDPGPSASAKSGDLPFGAKLSTVSRYLLGILHVLKQDRIRCGQISERRSARRDFATVLDPFAGSGTILVMPDLNRMAHRIVKEATEPREKPSQAQVNGRRGGQEGGRARAERLTPERHSEIARRAAHSRWSKQDRRSG